MPKAMLKFDLPEEQSEFNCAISGSDYKAVLEEVLQMLRSKIKYNDDLSPEQRETYAQVREWIFDLVRDFNISLD